MSGFVKIYQTILDSSVWLESHGTRIVWITMLAMADQRGIVVASKGGLAHRANVSRDELERALEVLSSPDPDSKSQLNEGRRIEPTEGGWLLLNYRAYRDLRTPQQVAGAERVRRHRSKNDDQTAVTGNNVTGGNDSQREVSASSSPSASKSSSGEPEDDELVFEVWRTETGHPRAVFDDKRRRRVRARRKEGFTAENLISAIRNRVNDPFLMGQNDTGRVYDGIETLLRDAAQVERLMALTEPMRGVPKGKIQQPKQPNAGQWKPPVER